MSTNTTTTTREFKNKSFNVSLSKTLKSIDNKKVHIVTRNIPFLIEIKNKANTNAVALEQIPKENISATLVYENDLDSQVISLKTSPLDYNVYNKDQTIIVEARIQTLSSKHENNLFKVIVNLNNTFIHTDSIKCVSKITSTINGSSATQTTVVADPKPQQQQPIVPTPTTPTTPPQQQKKQQTQQQQQPQKTVVKKSRSKAAANTKPTATTTNNNNNNTTTKKPTLELTKTVRKLKKLRQNDKNLISLLYQQNKLITSQLNSVTAIVNSLVAQHNKNSNINNSINNGMLFQPQLHNNHNNNIPIPSPSHEAPNSPLSLPQSPSISPPITNNNNNNHTFQFPTLETDALKAVAANGPTYSYTLDVSDDTNSKNTTTTTTYNNNNNEISTF